MSTNLRIATFNLENLDDRPGQKPTLNERIALMRPNPQAQCRYPLPTGGQRTGGAGSSPSSVGTGEAFLPIRPMPATTRSPR